MIISTRISETGPQFGHIGGHFQRRDFAGLFPGLNASSTFAAPPDSGPDFSPMPANIQDVLNGPVFQVVAEEATALGLECFVVGGFVRDLLLGRGSKDVDFVCLGDCGPLAEAVAHRLNAGHTLAVFRNFGTAQIKSEDWIVEFVSARKESYSHNSRKPSVEPGTLEEDLARRDLTINALAIGVSGNRAGMWIDLFDGRQDLAGKIIRTPLEPAATFSDDPLRMMRAVRFAAQLKFDIEPGTFAGIRDMKSRLAIISQERIAEEMNRILASSTPSYGFKLLYFSGLLEEFFPEMVALAGVENREGKSHKDNFFHTLEVLDNVAERSENLWLRWAAVLHDIAKPATKRYVPGEGWTFHGHEERGARMVPRLFGRMKQPLNEHMRYVQKLVRLHLRPISLTNVAVTDSAVRRLMFEAGPDLEDLMLLCRADVTTKNPNKSRRYLAKFDDVEEKMALVEESDRLRAFQPVLDGQMIMDLFAIPAGPVIGRIKDQIREAILEGEIVNTLEKCLERAVQLGSLENLKPRPGFDPEALIRKAGERKMKAGEENESVT